jgi:hypothetical protein
MSMASNETAKQRWLLCTSVHHVTLLIVVEGRPGSFTPSNDVHFCVNSLDDYEASRLLAAEDNGDDP